MTFNGTTVFPFRPNFISPKAGELDDFTYESTGIGKFTPWKPTSGPRRTITYPFLLETAAQIKQFRLFVNFTRGAQRGFWLPLYLGDYRLTADALAGATELTVEKVNLASTITSFAQFGCLALVTMDGLECHNIATVIASGAIETITLDEPLEADVVSNDTVCCGLIMARFDREPIEFKHDSDGIATVEQTFIECPQEYEEPHLGSAPVLLYRFTRSGTEWLYAGWGVDVTADSVVWTAADITNNAIRSGQDFLSDAVDLTIATDDATHPLRYYKDRTAMEQTTVEIRRLDMDGVGTTSTLLHKGTVENAEFPGKGIINCSLSSIFRVGENQAPRPEHTRLCQHRLFDPGCTKVADDYLITGTVVAITDDYVQVAEFATEATTQADPNWFALGRVKIGTETRLITGQDTDKVYINAPFNEPVAPSDAVSGWPGCDKRIFGGCTKFANTDNFLGFPFSPNSNAQFEALTTPKPKGGKKSSDDASTEESPLVYNAP